jgi:hypothetical protein
VGLLWRENLENRHYEGTQMAQQGISQCGAPSASSMWSSINWQQVEDDVFRFQMRIAKATKAQCWNKVHVSILESLLT